MSNLVAFDIFHLEEYFAKHEFSATNLLCCSDSESFEMDEILSLADEECLRLWKTMRLGYTEAQGMPLLRAECAKIYENVSSDNILMFSGAEEGIYCTLRTILGPNDHAIVVCPCYQSLLSIPQAICPVSTVNLTLTATRWILDASKIEASIIEGKTKVIILNFPHNPTGAVLLTEELLVIVEIARKHDVFILCDEVYRGLESRDIQICPQVADIYEKGLSLGGLSKPYGLAGLRIGWIAANKGCQVPRRTSPETAILLQTQSLISAIASNKHFLSICNSAPSEILALIAIRNREKIFLRNFDILEANKKIFRDFLGKYSQLFECLLPLGGCCGFMRVTLPDSSLKEKRSGGSENEDNDDDDDDLLQKLSDEIVLRYGALLLPGNNFPFVASTDVTRDSIYRYFFRMGLGRKSFPKDLLVFETAVRELLLPRLGLKESIQTLSSSLSSSHQQPTISRCLRYYRRVLITGVNGWLGQLTYRQLCAARAHEGWEIFGSYHRPNRKPAWLESEFGVCMDLCDEKSIDSCLRRIRPDAIIHLAAVSAPSQCHNQRDGALSSNCPSALLSVCASVCPSALFIFASTDMVYDGNSPPYTVNTNNIAANAKPVNAYGFAKLKFEQEILQALPNSSVILRLSNMLGPDFAYTPPDSPKFLTFLMRSLRAQSRIGLRKDEVRSFVWVQDVINVFIKLLQLRFRGDSATTASEFLALPANKRVFNVGGPEGLSRLNLARGLCEIMNMNFIVEEASAEPSQEESKSMKLENAKDWIVFETVAAETEPVVSLSNQEQLFNLKGVSLQSPRDITMDSSETERVLGISFTSVFAAIRHLSE